MADVKHCKAIVVDDHAAFRIGIASILRQTCTIANVIEASSLDEAVEILEATPDVSLATFDLAMPGMTSAATLRSVRESFPNLLCIVLTGSNVRRDILVALDAGVHGFIQKTAPVPQIAAAIRYVMGGDIYVPRELAELDGTSQTMIADATSSFERPAQAIDRLTPRQRQILEILSSGSKSNKDIARLLNLTENTVKVHVNAIFRALDVHDRDQIRLLVSN